MSLRHAPIVLVLALAPACDTALESHSDADADTGEVSGFHVAPISLTSVEVIETRPESGLPTSSPAYGAPIVAHFEGRHLAAEPAPFNSFAGSLASPGLLRNSQGGEADPAKGNFSDEQLAVATSTMASLVASVPAAATRSLIGERRFLMDLGGLVLAHGESVDPRWSAGPATSTPEPGGEFFWATRPVDEAALPAAHRLLLGQTVRVYSDSRELCVATVSGFSLEAALTHAPSPDWDDEGNPIEPTPLSYTAEEIFSEGVTMLKAELTPVFGNCFDGLWADVERDTRPRLYTKTTADKVLARKALGAWRKSSIYKAIETRYHELFSVDYPRPEGRWDEIEGSRPEVEVLTAGDDTLVVVSADSWGGCGSPGERGLAVFRVDGQHLRFVTGVAGDTAPNAWLDLDNDGHPEAIYRGEQMTRMIRFKTNAEPSALSDLYDLTDTLESVYIPDYTDHGCGC